MSVENDIKDFCNRIGQDSLLVQGAGGNISWKSDDILWIKASGKWISDASSENIFVPVDLKHLKESLEKKIFSVVPLVIGKSLLRPSIETILHALLPQKIVVHLHAVEALARLVRKNGKKEIKSIMGDELQIAFVDYFKPGAKLAEAIALAVEGSPEVKVIFLKNHGIVISGNSVLEISALLEILSNRLKSKITLPNNIIRSFSPLSTLTQKGYKLCQNKEIQSLVMDQKLYKFLTKYWALCPDHVVFLGSEPFTVTKVISKYMRKIDELNPLFIFIKNIGVFQGKSVTETHVLQLKLFYELAIRQPTQSNIHVLSATEIDELLNWEAEDYRKKIKK